ncbi:MAG: hypothetical protein ABR521_11340 [Gaiellaceae bacterium]
MRRLLVTAVAALSAAPLALAATPSAQAGCWATVKLSSMPSGLVWNVKVTPLQHGRTTLPDAKPRIEIRRGKARWRVFAARPAAKRGVYRARVVFPAAGTWRLRVWDGFEPHCARYHTYAPVTVSDI